MIRETGRRWAEVLRARLSGKPKAHFLHISKTGGTALTHALHSHLDAGRYFLRIRPHEVSVRDVPAGDKFFFLRDPARRFVSAFYSRQRQGRPRYSNPWTPAEAAAFRLFPTADTLARDLSTESAERRAHAEAAMREIQLLRNPYGDWLIDRATLEVRVGDLLFVGFQESLDADFARLLPLLGLPAELALPRDDFHAHRSPAGLDMRLSRTAQANLRVWFRKDYEWLELIQEWIADGRIPGSVGRG